MNRSIFVMMVGLPGSGKSTEAQKLAFEYDANIHSSDDIREELSGDINNQDINDLVFKTLHSRIKEDLLNGKNCIYDATNISYKRRMAFLCELNKIPCVKVCVFMATPYEECLKNNSKRDRVVPEGVIKRMYMNFDVPFWYEGWDKILTVYQSYRGYYGDPISWCENMKQYDQKNPHHTLSLGYHCELAYNAIQQKYGTTSNRDVAMRVATMLHDEGKEFCQTFVNCKNEVTDIAHYYHHEHVGSYDSLFYDMTCDPLDVAAIIRWHMQPYFWEKDNNEKSHDKYRRLWGLDLYADIMALHLSDKNAH